MKRKHKGLALAAIALGWFLMYNNVNISVGIKTNDEHDGEVLWSNWKACKSSYTSYHEGKKGDKFLTLCLYDYAYGDVQYRYDIKIQ